MGRWAGFARVPSHPLTHFLTHPARIIRQFHHVIEKPVALAHVQDGHLAGVGTGDRLEAFDALEFARERAVVIEP